MSTHDTAGDALRIVDAGELHACIKRLYIAHGVPEGDAEIIADSLVSAQLRGVDTHGIRFIPQYIARIKNNDLNRTPNIAVIRETPVSALVDGDGGSGQVIGARAMRIAIDKAKRAGIGLVSVFNANHNGAAAYYTMQAQREGLIGFTVTSAGATIAPTGGKTKCFGNNPWSFAFPHRPGDIPIVVDMANSVVANANISIAKRLGKKIPPTWGLDADGVPTDDPNAVALLQLVGGYKGYGISVVAEILATVLTGRSVIGNDCLPLWKAEYGGHYTGLGQLYAAIDPEMFLPLESFYERQARFVAQLKASELAEGSAEVLLPGEKEYRCRIDRAMNGIPINGVFVDDLGKLCVEAGVAGLNGAFAKS